MERRIVALFCCFIIIAALVTPTALADNSSTTVYITDSGAKYHRSDCSYLKSRNSVTLRYAAEHGYTACSRCTPPRPDFQYETAYIRQVRSGSSSSSNSVNTESKTTQIQMSTRRSIEFADVLPSIIVVSIISFISYHIIKDERETKRRKEEEREKERLRRQKEEEIEKQQEEEKKRKERLQVAYRIAEWGKTRNALLESTTPVSVLDYINAPIGDYVNSEGLPYSRVHTNYWGDKYTFFATKSGTVYHTPTCSYSTYFYDQNHTFTGIAINAYELNNERSYVKRLKKSYHPCRYCKPTLPDVSWVDRLKETRDKFDEYCLWGAIYLPERVFPNQVNSPEKEEMLKTYITHRQLVSDHYTPEIISNYIDCPNTEFIGRKGLPANKSDGGVWNGGEPWGDKFTFYYDQRAFYSSSTGIAAHTKDCPRMNVRGRSPINAYEWLLSVPEKRRENENDLLSLLHACPDCRPELPDFSWYIRWKEITTILDKYDLGTNRLESKLVEREYPQFICLRDPNYVPEQNQGGDT